MDTTRWTTLRMSRGGLWLALAAAIIHLAWAPAGFAQEIQQVPTELQRAALAGEWEVVADGLSHVMPESGSTVARLLKGHATLATNRNDESLCLLAGVFGEARAAATVPGLSGPMEMWSEWTGTLIAANPGNPIAHYLRADASARAERWDEALSFLDRGLAADPGHALLLNARGTVQTARGEWDYALNDLNAAIASDPDLADAYASRGALNLMRRSGPEGAKAWFDRALERSARFALALNGRGVAAYALGKTDDAADDFEAAAEVGCLNVSLGNLEALVVEQAARVERESTAFASNVGSSILMRRTQQAVNHVYNLFEMRDAKRAASLMDNNVRTSSSLNLGANTVGSQVVGVNGNANVEIQTSTNPTRSRSLELSLNNIRNNRTELSRLGSEIDQIRAQGGPGAGGVSLDMDRAAVDSGAWPVDTFFGLYYVIEPRERRPTGPGR